MTLGVHNALLLYFWSNLITIGNIGHVCNLSNMYINY